MHKHKVRLRALLAHYRLPDYSNPKIAIVWPFCNRANGLVMATGVPITHLTNASGG
jgi:hypothetical protein